VARAFSDITDAKSFQLSLLASIFTVFLITGIELLHAHLAQRLPIPPISVKWILFIVLFFLMLYYIKKYQILKYAEWEIETATKKKK